MSSAWQNFTIRLIFIFFALVLESAAIETIKPDHPNFQYTGRIDRSIPDEAILYWPGSYIKASFEGPFLMILMDDQTGNSYYNVFIDEDFEHPYLINCKVGYSPYYISNYLADTVHTLHIFRRTEASTGPTRFLGIQILDGKTLVAPPERPGRNLLFYGNSITCGLGNEAPDNIDFGDEVYNNNFQAYGAITSRLLDADYMCIAKSGIGLMISWFDLIMPQYYYRLNPDNPDSLWDFNQYIADVVVVNIFQNDSWLIGNLDPVPDSTQITAAYVDFIRKLRKVHPQAFIVCALGSMDATRSGSPWPGYIEKAVKIMETEDNDTNLGTYFFPFDPAWTKHPRVRHHQAMANDLTDYIAQKMGWVVSTGRAKPSMPPAQFELYQNYPNPFPGKSQPQAANHSQTVIPFRLDIPGKVTLQVYDLNGRLVRTLKDEYMNTGLHRAVFDGRGLPNGVYLYRLSAGSQLLSGKALLLK